MHFQVLGYQSFCLSNSTITYGRRYYNDNYSVLEIWLTLSGNVILKGIFRTFLKVPVFSCCFTVDSRHKILMSGVKGS